MKHSIQFSILSAALLLGVLSVSAAPVSRDNARKVAERVLGDVVKSEAQDNLALRRMPRQESADTATCFYIFTAENGAGSVFIAADDCVLPLLGYTDAPIPATGDLPLNVKSWLDGYSRQITYVREHNLQPSADVRKAWSRVTKGDVDSKTIVIDKLIATQWDQVEPYNLYTPDNTPTGCVATAMAQLMKYWEYPERGIGSRSYRWPANKEVTLSADFENTEYKWKDMPEYINLFSSKAQKQAVATLMYHCGVATHMSYEEEGSGTFVIESYSARRDACAEYALKTYFGYKDSMFGAIRDYKLDEDENIIGRYPDEEWLQMVKDELNAGRPVLYSGYGEEGGHAFICDGYTTHNYFHFNWGWSGAYDGWFLLNDLTLPGVGTGGGDGDFNTLQHALFGVEPDRIEQLTPGQYDLQMASRLTVSEHEIDFFQMKDISVSAMVRNCGEKNFSGGIYAVLSDDKGNVIDTVGGVLAAIQSTQRLMFSAHYSPDEMLTPGVYSFRLWYNDSNSQHGEIGKTSYDNFGSFVIYYKTDVINAVSEFRFGAEELHSMSNASVSITAKNVENVTYARALRLVLVNSKMTDISQILTTLELTDGLAAGGTVDVVFDGILSVEPGRYFLALQYQAVDGSWALAGSEMHSNPVWINVTGAETALDNIQTDTTAARKVIRDGRIFILSGGKTYTILGTLVE